MQLQITTQNLLDTPRTYDEYYYSSVAFLSELLAHFILWLGWDPHIRYPREGVLNLGHQHRHKKESEARDVAKQRVALFLMH